MPAKPKVPAARTTKAVNAAHTLRANGIQRFAEGRWAEAEALLTSALALQPADTAVLYHLAAIALQTRDAPRALRYTAQGVKHAAPQFAPIWMVHALALQANGRFDDALKAFEHTLQLDPRNVVALINHGVLLREMLRRKESLEQFLQVLEIDPANEAALSNAATLVTEMRDSDGTAIDLFRRLVRINPAHPYALGKLVFESLRNCDWSELAQLEPIVVDEASAPRRFAQPFAMLALSGSERAHAGVARQFAADRYPAAPQPLWTGQRYTHQRLRVAYVSPDFKEHPVAHLMAGVFEGHDRTRFEVFAFSKSADDGSALRRRVQAAFEHFIDVNGQSPRQIAQALRDNEIDVAIDLAGYTLDGALDALAFRPAPVQVNYLGYPGTLGTSYIDFILADRHVIPEHNRASFTEEVVHLPDSYLPPAVQVLPAERTPTRAECGLPETGVVLCCFNHVYKIHPTVFAVWMDLLRQRPDAVLWLSCRTESARENLRRSAEGAGIAASRLVFAGRMPRVEDHLARYRVADLFLDTVPYNAHTTAADALMVGLPVVTCVGQAFPGRVAASLLHAIGLPELATPSLDAYRALVLDLMAQPERLAALRQRLATNRTTHPLFDTQRFCRNLETALLQMHQAKVGAPALAELAETA